MGKGITVQNGNKIEYSKIQEFLQMLGFWCAGKKDFVIFLQDSIPLSL
ncbi:hypothetical protein [Cecembia rubra]|nr:hypothetical protein [Cecembia rubra]